MNFLSAKCLCSITVCKCPGVVVCTTDKSVDSLTTITVFVGTSVTLVVSCKLAAMCSALTHQQVAFLFDKYKSVLILVGRGLLTRYVIHKVG